MFIFLLSYRRKFNESNSEDDIVYPKKRVTPPSSPSPFNRKRADNHSTYAADKLPSITINKPKPKVSARDTYSEDDDDDDENKKPRSHVRPVVSPTDNDTNYNSRSLNQPNATSNTNPFNKKKKVIGGSNAANRDATNKRPNDDELKPYRSTYESYPDNSPWSSSTKKITHTDDTAQKPLSKAAIPLDSTKHNARAFNNDLKSYNSGLTLKGANYSDNEDDYNKNNKNKVKTKILNRKSSKFYFKNLVNIFNKISNQ